MRSEIIAALGGLGSFFLVVLLVDSELNILSKKCSQLPTSHMGALVGVEGIYLNPFIIRSKGLL